MAESFQPSRHQVAGHRFEEGRLGSLTDGKGIFFKPLQNKDRGDAEIQFYEKFWANDSIPGSMKAVFPRFYGTIMLELPPPLAESTGVPTATRYVVLEDLCEGYKEPCIMDIKIGRQTWHEGDREDYIQKCIEKDEKTTSAALGFRIAGMQVFNAAKGQMWRADRKWCKKITARDVDDVFRLFVSPCQNVNALTFDPAVPLPPPPPTSNGVDAPAVSSGSCCCSDCSILPSAIYCGRNGAVEQLEKVKGWFKQQTNFHFYSSSVLLLYEGSPDSTCPATAAVIGEDAAGAAAMAAADIDAAQRRRVSVRLVDFAHVTDGRGALDGNFLEGLVSLIDSLHRVGNQDSF